MKKVMFTEETSEIHISDISIDDIILVQRKGKTIGTIMHDSNHKWYCGLLGSKNNYNRSLSDTLAWGAINDCEFYVLD